jgi:hypothetical protein
VLLWWQTGGSRRSSRPEARFFGRVSSGVLPPRGAKNGGSSTLGTSAVTVAPVVNDPRAVRALREGAARAFRDILRPRRPDLDWEVHVEEQEVPEAARPIDLKIDERRPGR